MIDDNSKEFIYRHIGPSEKEQQNNTLTESVSSVNFPSHVLIESIVATPQNGGGKQYYDNIYTRNVSKF